MKKREQYVDIIKGFCIICVVYVHINIVAQNFENIDDIIQNIVSQFFLSVFFIVTGFYLKNLNEPKDFFSKKIKKWYIKLIIVYIPFVLLHNIFIKSGIYEVDKLYNGKLMLEYTPNMMIIKIIETLLLMGREPLLGAMWFFIVQIISLIGLELIICFSTIVTNKNDKVDKNKLIFIILLILLIISSVLTEKFSLTIPRISIATSVMILIFMGYYMNQILNVKYNSKFFFIISVIAILTNAIFDGKMLLNTNKIISPITFMISSIAGIYMLGYIAKKIERFKFSKVFSICGRYSFQIMAFHLICFKLANIIVNTCGIENCTTMSELIPNTSNILGFVIYLVVGIVCPILITMLYEKIKDKLIQIRRKNKKYE